MGINLHKLNKKLGLEHCVVQREPGFVPSGYFVHDVMVEKHVIIIIITRPRPAFGRLGLGRSSGG